MSMHAVSCNDIHINLNSIFFIEMDVSINLQLHEIVFYFLLCPSLLFRGLSRIGRCACTDRPINISGQIL